MPLVSVIMPVYNGERFLAEAIESVLAQTLADFELIVVDDASTDGSAEVIRSYAALDTRIRPISLPDNVGMASARNAGLALASGAYIAGMDCDDVSLPRRLEQQAGFMASNPRIGALGAQFQRVAYDLSPLRDFPVPADHARIVLNMFIGGGFILHSTLFVRRALLDNVGGYQPGRRHMDDLELHGRLLARSGIRYANLKEVLMRYRRHEAADGFGHGFAQLAQRWVIPKGNMLKSLWGEAPPATLDRFARLHLGMKLGWAQRRAARADLARLVGALVAKGWVDAADEATLVASASQRLESAMPRRWQMLLHWYRYRIKGRGT